MTNDWRTSCMAGLTTLGELGIVSSKAPAHYAAQSMEGRRRVREWSDEGARNPRAIETSKTGAEDRQHRPGRHLSCLTLDPREGGAISNVSKGNAPSTRCAAAKEAHKSPASEEAGPMIRLGQAPRRDQISVKLSSSSTFTSDA
jgi:hypothetical protein